jgi:potassium-dependent mechanosensitive channel
MPHVRLRAPIVALAVVCTSPVVALATDVAPRFLTEALVSIGAIAAAVALQWALRRLSYRLPRLLARRTTSAPGVDAPWVRPLQVVLLVPQAALWLAVAYIVSEQAAPLRAARQSLTAMLMMTLTTPLLTVDDRAYALRDVLELPVVLAVVWAAVGALTSLFKAVVLRPTGVDRGVEETIGVLLRYTLTFVGALMVLQAWGIDVRSLALVASVLGVGLGFGLQNLANNFVSGLVMSLERPIQPGDFVRVGDWQGTVQRIGGRSTEIRTTDNVTILIPNSRVLETEVVNWTHGDPVARIHVPVGVAYGSPMVRVRAALLEAATHHPHVMEQPPPRVEFRGFGDSALNFELLVWTRDPRGQFKLTSDLNYRIEANLRQHGVSIPFPQRDLHVHAPDLERVVGAWSRRHFTETELHPGNGAAPASDHVPPGFDAVAHLDDHLGAETWTDASIDALVGRMRGPDGVPILDRRHLFTVYPRCFVGRDAIDWLGRSLGLAREDAVAAGQILVDRGVIHHVLDEHTFKDGHYFYRFRADEPT